MLPRPTSPYHFLGLWRNPFGELSREERVQVAVLDLQTWLDFLSTGPRTVLQFVGDCGYGKTTRLLALQHALRQHHQREVPYIYFPELESPWKRVSWSGHQRSPSPPWPKLPDARPLIVDELQRCRKRQMRQLLRLPGPLVLGTHVDRARKFEQHGFEVCSVNVESASTVSLIRTALNRRIEASRVPQTIHARSFRCPTLSEKSVTLLARQYKANFRAIENHLYHEIQDCIREQKLWQPAT